MRRVRTDGTASSLSQHAREAAARNMQHLYVDYVKMRFFSLGLGTGAALQAVAASVVIMLFAYDPRSGAIHELARKRKKELFPT